MESEWSGDAENAFFSAEVFDKHRVLLQPEYEYSARTAKDAYYVIGVDVGRKGCTSEAIVIKVTPQAKGFSVKTIVNLYSWEDEHFETQAINIKKLFVKFRARRLAIDANGIGMGLIDYMVKSQIDPETGEVLPPFGVDNDEDGTYKRYRTPDTLHDAMYLIKANAPINTEAHVYVQTQLASGRVKFLIDERQAKVKLMEKKLGQTMSPEKRAERLQPFMLTTVLREQMLNLVEQNEGINIILKQASRGIKKDKFSAFEYGMYYIKKAEDAKRKRHRGGLSQLMFFS